MFEYDVPDNYHIKITQDPARLFTLSIGILGDLAARSQNGMADSAAVADLREYLQFSARFLLLLPLISLRFLHSGCG
jgi:POLQ-like helicase